MKPETLRAKTELENGTFTLVVVKNNSLFTSKSKRIAPILELLKSDNNGLRGASAADKVIGGAAAFLFVYGGVTEVYGEIMSEKAVTVLENAGIPFSFGMLVPYIINNKGDGLCPLEQLCLKLKSPDYAYKKINVFLRMQAK